MYLILKKGISYTRGKIHVMNGQKIKVDEKTAIDLMKTGRFEQENGLYEDNLEDTKEDAVKQEKEETNGKKNSQKTKKEEKQQDQKEQETVPAYE